MGTWKFKNEGKALGTLNNTNGPVSAYKHTDGNIYYSYAREGEAYGARTFIQKIAPDGTETALGFDDRGWFASEHVAVPYHNEITGNDEIHWVLGRRAGGALFNQYSIKTVFSPTPISSTFTPSGTLRCQAQIVSDNNYPSRSNFLYPVFVNGVLYYVWFPNNATYTVQKYNPATSTWIDVVTNGSRNSDIGETNATVFAIGSKIYMFSGAGATSHMQCLDTNDNSFSVIFANAAGANTRLIYEGAWYSTWTGTAPAINQAIPFVLGTDVYFIGGRTRDSYNGNENALVPYIFKWDSNTNTFTDTRIPNVVNFATPSNALNIGGELLICGSYTGGNTGTIVKYTYVLDSILNFTATYQPEPPIVTLTWADNPEESFYVIEKKVNTGAWEAEASKNANATSHQVTGVDLINNTYSFRIRAGKVVVS
jgi:hypothetical protein